MLTGNTGASGTSGIGIASSIVEYTVYTSGTDIPIDNLLDSSKNEILDSSGSTIQTSNWTTDIPSVPEGYYLWTRVTITYDDGSDTVSYSVAKDGIDGEDGQQGAQGIQGPKGDPGDDGVDISSVTKYYCLSATTPAKPTSISTLPPSGWSEVEPSYTSGSTLSLYSTELIIFSDNSFSYSTPCLSSSYEAAKQAYTAAEAAKTTANQKNAVFYQGTAPSSTDRKEYDVWFDTSNGNKMYYWNGSAWTPRQFGTASLAEKCITAELVAANAITTDNIVAGTITSAKLNTTEIFSNSAVITEIFAHNVTATGTITGAVIQSAGYTAGTSPYSAAGMLIDLSAGKIEAVNFGVTTAGSLYAKAGQIGGWTLSDHSMSATVNGNYVFFGDGSTSGSGNENLHVMLVKLADGSFPFFVRNNGYLNATNANISGSITATSLTAKNTYYIHNASGTRKEALTAPDASFGSSLAIGNGFTACYLHGSVITGGNLTVLEDGTGAITCGSITEGGKTLSAKYAAYSHTHSGYAASSHTHNYLVGSGYRVRCGAGVSSGTYGFHPRTDSDNKASDNTMHLGASAARWIKVWAVDGAINTSDERDKNILGDIDDVYTDVFMDLNVVKFKWKDRPSDEPIHLGIGAQTTEKILQCHGLSLQEAGFLIHDYWDEDTPDGRHDRYSVSYPELEIIMIPIVQKHEREMKNLKSKIESLESRINQQQLMIQQLIEKLAS